MSECVNEWMVLAFKEFVGMMVYFCRGYEIRCGDCRVQIYIRCSCNYPAWHH